MRKPFLVLLFAALALIVAACGDDDDTAATTTTAEDTTTTTEGTTTTSGDEAMDQSCTNEDDGYALQYPDDWHTNTGEVLPTCELFDVDPLEVAEGTEPDAPIIVDVAEVTFEQVAEPSRGEEEQSRSETEIAGRQAVRLVVVATEDAPLREPGTLATRWVIDLGQDRTLIASAEGTDSVPFEQAQRTLDAMIATVELTADAG